MKEITLPQGKIVIDEKIKFKHSDTPKWIYDKDLSQPFNLDIVERINQIGEEFKIIASTFFISKEVPVYVEKSEASMLANAHVKDWEYEKILGSGPATLAHDNFVNGYELAKSKGIYNESELRAIVKSVMEFMSHSDPKEFENWFERKLKTYKEKQVEFEMEDVYITSGKEENGFVNKGEFFTQKEALDLANKLNEKQDIFYYDWSKIKKIKITIDEYGQKWCYRKKYKLC